MHDILGLDGLGMQCMIREQETFQRADTSALDAVGNCVTAKDKSSARLGALAWAWMG